MKLDPTLQHQENRCGISGIPSKISGKESDPKPKWEAGAFLVVLMICFFPSTHAIVGPSAFFPRLHFRQV